jgi:hypothetical protein
MQTKAKYDTVEHCQATSGVYRSAQGRREIEQDETENDCRS